MSYSIKNYENASEPYKSEALSREKVHYSISKWVDGKPQKPTIRSDSPVAAENKVGSQALFLSSSEFCTIQIMYGSGDESFIWGDVVLSGFVKEGRAQVSGKLHLMQIGGSQAWLSLPFPDISDLELGFSFSSPKTCYGRKLAVLNYQ
ncbi:hypothetical protein HAX54_011246 [Datura stramonium]|uniref:Uncharacterized protein n=1 Tax=Datura stramonium TaxID=4076 RepID=A0ABS8TJC0_DATST|nr:hypothetical protein [Datura stramonium]